MSFLADILGEQPNGTSPDSAKPVHANKLPRQNHPLDLNAKAPVIRHLPNHYYKGIIQQTKRKTGGITARALNTKHPQRSTVNNSNLLRHYSRRPVSPEDEVDQMLTARRRTISPPNSFAALNGSINNRPSGEDVPTSLLQ